MHSCLPSITCRFFIVTHLYHNRLDSPEKSVTYSDTKIMKGCSSVIHVRLPDALIEKAKKRSQDVGMSEWVRGLIINALGMAEEPERIISKPVQAYVSLPEPTNMDGPRHKGV